MNTIVCNNRIVKLISANKKLECRNCPACNGNVVRNGPMWVCEHGADCPAAQVGKIKKWIKKRDIKFLGDSATDKLIAAGVVKSVTGLYHMTESEMITAGVGQGMSKKILNQIEKSRACSLSDLIGSLSLDMLGRSEAANLVGHGIDTLSKWKSLTVQQIESFPGYQSTKADRITMALTDNWNLIEELSKELVMESASAPVTSGGGKLNNSSFCFTGTMSKPRKELEALVFAAGGEVKSVSKSLTYLVIADPNSTSSKAVKARKQGVSLISEDEFLEMV